MACPAGGWVRACGLVEITQNPPAHADVCGYPVCLVRAAGGVYTLRDECTHESVPMSEGEVADGATECWLHGSRFDLATGPVAVLGVRVHAGQVYVCLPQAMGPRGEARPGGT